MLYNFIQKCNQYLALFIYFILIENLLPKFKDPLVYIKIDYQKYDLKLKDL